MRILWVKAGGMWPLTSGARLRSFNTVSELSRLHDVSVVTTHGPGDDPEALRARLPHCERAASFPHAPAKRGSAGFVLALARSWFSRLPLDLWKWRIPALRDGVADLLAGGGFDLCIADAMATMPNLPPRCPVPLVLAEHNVEHMIWKRLGRTVPVWQRPLVELEWRKLRRCEARACAQAALTIAISEPDRDLLSGMVPAATVRGVPTGVDTSYFAPRAEPEVPGRLVLTGSMDWYPNEDAALYFIDAILPSIRREFPQASLTIVGRDPSPRLRAAAARRSVEVTGTVDDVRPYVAQATMLVVPLRVGGGTRLKIFEALAMEKAVVSTSLGAEGLPLVSGTHFLEADGPAEFARAVVSLLRSPDRRNALGVAGRELVIARHSWAMVAREFEACCAEAAAHAASDVG